ncbi:unnamed protein product [Ilex paraguariensis]|uniref:Uncharacterized protein n=1 Tax=Ilex paraguariensis TaxID=185542 RepID=A0ABC8TWE9_9AQUA
MEEAVSLCVAPLLHVYRRKKERSRGSGRREAAKRDTWEGCGYGCGSGGGGGGGGGGGNCVCVAGDGGGAGDGVTNRERVKSKGIEMNS